MSTSASLNISLVGKNSLYFSTADIIDLFINYGWNIVNSNKILYLPLGDYDGFDWREDRMDKDSFYELIRQKELTNEIIGVGLFWNDSNIGGALLFHSNCEISFNCTINRKKLFNNVTDVNWYLERIIPSLNTDLIVVEKFSFTQC